MDFQISVHQRQEKLREMWGTEWEDKTYLPK